MDEDGTKTSARTSEGEAHCNAGPSSSPRGNHKGNLDVGNGSNLHSNAERKLGSLNACPCRKVPLEIPFIEFIEPARQKKVRSRFTQSPSGVPYVFLARPHGEDRNTRRKELRLRCFVSRGLYPNQTKVVGIATEQYEPGKGFSLDVLLFSQDNWTAKDKSLMEQVQSELGYFKKPIKTYGHEDEYPNPSKL